MNAAGGQNKPKIIVKLPPKKTPREWREHYRAKLQALESISFEIMGKRRGGS